MNTDDLITSLASELTPVRRGVLTGAVLIALSGGLAVTVALFALFWGIRSDPGSILHDLPLLAKTLLPLGLAALALPWMLAQARPAGHTAAARLVWTVPVITLLLILWTLYQTPVVAWPATLRGQSIVTCLTSIPLLSLPILAPLLLALRRGAPGHPARCGAVAGLLSAGSAAAVYSLYCTENAPAFYGLWYTFAILAVTGFGALCGHRLLRW